MGLRKHKKEQHTTTTNDQTDNDELLKCDICPGYFTNARGLVVHKSKLHWNRKCPDCGESFTQHQNQHSRLRMHIEQYHPNHLPQLKFLCGRNKCWRRFAKQTELEEHMNENKCEAEDALNCLECNKRFETIFKLQLHIKAVHSDRSFVCDVCDKGYKTKGTLKVHLNYHKGPDEWSWQCSECGRRFINKQRLELHARTHTKAKPFMCNICGKCIAHKQLEKSHESNTWHDC